MEELIRNFRDEKESGLLLIDYPTGVGKTYNAVKYILNHKDDEKIFYITPLKKNLFEVYEKLNMEMNDENWFSKNVILLKSNFDSIFDNILDINDNDGDELLSKESFKS